MVNPIDGLGNKLDLLARTKTVVPTLKGRLEWNSRRTRATPGTGGCTECLPATVMDSEVEELIGGGETAFQDKRAVE